MGATKGHKLIVAAVLAVVAWSTAVGQVSDGVVALERGDKGKAKLIFEQTLKSDPRNIDAHTYLGMIAAEANQLTEAEQHFAAAASFAPTEPSTRNNYGAILLRLGRTAQAQTEFEYASRALNDAREMLSAAHADEQRHKERHARLESALRCDRAALDELRADDQAVAERGAAGPDADGGYAQRRAECEGAAAALRAANDDRYLLVIVGQVTRVQRPGKVKGTAELQLAFEQIRLPDGRSAQMSEF